MAERPMTREKAITWWIGLFVISVFGTAFVIWRWYRGRLLWLGVPLYAALFVCASVVGMQADPKEMKKNLGESLRALVIAAPIWALAVVVLELLILILLGWSWWWRSPLPLALGVLAGLTWSRQRVVPRLAALEGEVGLEADSFFGRRISGWLRVSNVSASPDGVTVVGVLRGAPPKIGDKAEVVTTRGRFLVTVADVTISRDSPAEAGPPGEAGEKYAFRLKGEDVEKIKVGDTIQSRS